MKRPALLALLTAVLAVPALRAEDPLGRILDHVYVMPSDSGDRSRVGTQSKPSIAVVTESEILSRLEKELANKFTTDGELRLSFGRPWQPIRVPSADWTVTLTDLPIGGLSKSFLLRVKIASADRVWFDSQLVMQAELWKSVLQATRRLEKGQPLDSTSAEMQTMDVLRERLSPIPATTKLDDLEVVQTVMEGRPLTSKDVMLSPLVRKGAMVDVVVAEGGMSISMKGMAMGTGGAGDPITVRNMDTRKDFQARVVSRNSVRVTF